MIIETNPTVQTIETMTTDAAPFPAATGKWMPPVQDLDDLYTPEQQAFNATIAGKGLSAITDEDREAAARVGLTLCDYRILPAKCGGGWPGQKRGAWWTR